MFCQTCLKSFSRNENSKFLCCGLISLFCKLLFSLPIEYRCYNDFAFMFPLELFLICNVDHVSTSIKCFVLLWLVHKICYLEYKLGTVYGQVVQIVKVCMFPVKMSYK